DRLRAGQLVHVDAPGLEVRADAHGAAARARPALAPARPRPDHDRGRRRDAAPDRLRRGAAPGPPAPLRARFPAGDAVRESDLLARLDELQREQVLRVALRILARVGVPVAGVGRVAHERALAGELEAGAHDLVAHERLVDAVERLAVLLAGAGARA